MSSLSNDSSVPKLIPSINIMIYGPPKSGCTTLARDFAEVDPNEPIRNYAHTLERDLTIGNPFPVTVALWDFNGCYNFKSWLSRASVVLFILDVTDKNGLTALDDLINSMPLLTHLRLPLVLIANKCDDQENRVISSRTAQNWAKTNCCVDYFELSAKNSLGCLPALESIARLGLKKELGTASGTVLDALPLPNEPDQRANKALLDKKKKQSTALIKLLSTTTHQVKRPAYTQDDVLI